MRRALLRGFVAAIAVAFAGWSLAVAADDAPAKKDAPAADAKGADDKPATEGLGQRRDKEVSLGEEISFRQSEVTAEMTDLEHRMLRLSEALKSLEPENSSRLMLGLKYAREELILLQMKEAQAALSKLSLKTAVEEQKQLLAKLERLQQLLLSSDLDFDMKLERLRQIREVMRKLDTVIKEEAREEKISKKAAEKEKELAELAERRVALEELIKQQNEHIGATRPLAKESEPNENSRAELSKLAEGQNKTRKDTQALATSNESPADPKNLNDAAESMKSAADSLEKPAAAEAMPAMEKALASLQKELEETAKKEAEAKAALDKEKFAAMQKDQAGNRQANGDVSEMTRGLGTSGTAALAELMRAGGFMSGAEGAFGGGQAGAGNGDQANALAALKYAQELLAEEEQRLAKQLRREVKKRVMDGLKVMLEEQTAIRKRTESLTSGVKEGSRQALAGVTALAKREEKIATLAQELVNMVEETEFGIALPAALASVRDAAEAVQMSLADGDASEDVVAAEKQIEADLNALIDIVAEMNEQNDNGKPRKGRRGEEDERKKRDKIITELKLIRLLQTRVQQNTADVDGKRATASLSPLLKKRIEDLEGRQEDIREATQRLSEERGDEIPQP